MATQSVTSILNANSSSSTSTGSAAAKTSSTLVSKDDFLKILTTQLKYQNPLQPMQPDQFLTQLSQLTQVEQLTNIASSLDSLKTSATNSSASQWVSAIGSKMNVDSTTLSYGDQAALVPSGDYDSIVLTLTGVSDGSTKEVTFKAGDALAYTNEEAADVTVSAQAIKNNQTTACSTSVYRVIRGVQMGASGAVLMAGNGDGYTADKIIQITQ
jgi:flagellar basal-body rod modification protein FlgD